MSSTEAPVKSAKGIMLAKRGLAFFMFICFLSLIMLAGSKVLGSVTGEVNGSMRAGLTRGKTGVQTVYDVFAVAPLGAGVVDTTAGSALVTGWFTGVDLKNLLEFLLVDNPTHPGEFFPRSSGMRFRYDQSRPKFDAVTAIELGDVDRGYKPIDISGKDGRLYSLTCP